MFENKKIFFPIKTKTACPLKWGWSTLNLKTGKTSSCHRCEKLNINEENFSNFHNLPHKIKEREIMLQGKWPTKENGGSGHCQFCKVHEDVGELSDRQHHLSIPNLSPKEILENNTAVNVTPTILEIYLNNTCNMKCVYCGPYFSTQWQTELKKYGEVIVDQNIKQTILNTNETLQKKLFHKTLQWIEKYGDNLKRLHILGGEPFYQNEFKTLLEFLKNKKFKHLELNTVTNLMTKENIFKEHLEIIKMLIKNRDIKRLDLTASIDNWGNEAEYTRTGLKIEHWKKLFEHCVEQPWIKLNINSTITSLTLRSKPQLLEYINTFRKSRLIEHYGNEVSGHLSEILHPKIYGKEFWRKDFEKILELIPNNHNESYKKLVKGMYESLPSTGPDKEKISKLKLYLNTLDQRRNTKWRTVFPYLDI